MKKINSRYYKNIVAGLMIVCMVIADGALAIVYKNTDSDNVSVQYENHEMEKYFADGDYNGTDSSFEVINDEEDEVVSYEKVTHFNILEIVRGEGLGTIGYSLEGYEPFPVDTAEMKRAYMDAMINVVCGEPDTNYYKELPDDVKNFRTQFSDGEKIPFDAVNGYYTGYYKYVGAGNGVYSVINNTLDRANYKVKMVSKFYSPGGVSSNRNNDYIWVESSQTVGELKDSGTIKADDILVTNHRRFKYVNNNIFFQNFYTPQSYDKSNSSYGTSTVEDWKKTHKIQLKTVAWNDDALDEKLINWADLIYISNGDGVYSNKAYAMYQTAAGKTLPDINNLPKMNIKTWKQTLQIYDRVVAKEDCAIVVDGKSNFTGGKIDTNFNKLIAMLFLVNNKKDPDGIYNYGSGRAMFMDYMQSYIDNNLAPSLRITAKSNSYNGLTEENGYMYQDFPRVQVNANVTHDDSASRYFDINGTLHEEDCYFQKSKSNTTDYIYIDESNGNFMVKTDNSGKVYEVDYEIWKNGNKEEGFARRYVSWTKQSDKLIGKNNSSQWPWDRDGECLKYWWFHHDVTDQRCHTPLYFQYYYTDDGAWGPYRAIGDPEQGSYKNQSFSYENGVFKGNLISNAIAGRKVKREYTDESEGHSEKVGTPHYFFLSLNIVNGDGVNKEKGDGILVKQKGSNKVMYINDYEIEKMDVDKIPVNFILRTSEDISKIELVGKSSSVTYSGTAENDITKTDNDLSFSGGLTLENITFENVDDKSKVPTETVKGTELNVYKYRGHIDIPITDLKKTNNKYELRAWVPYPENQKKVIDTIIIVRRDFFMLD